MLLSHGKTVRISLIFLDGASFGDQYDIYYQKI